MRNRKALAALATSLMLIGATVSPVFAAAGGGTDYTPVGGTSCNFNKYFIMDEGDNVPNATFSFTVSPGTARSADTSDNAVMQVLPGVGEPSIADVTFSSSDTTATEAGDHIDVTRTQEDRTGVAGTDTVQLDAGEKYATRQATVSFDGITFDEPGIYRYIITEVANAEHTAAGITHDTDIDRVLDVYVTDDGSGNLVVASYVLHTDDDDVVINSTMGSADVAQATAALDDKTDGFTNEYSSKDLKIRKEVTGNQASHDKYFEYTVVAANVDDNDVYTVSLSNDNDSNTNDGNASATSGTNSATRSTNQGKTNPTSVTGSQLKNGVKFYLAHNQEIVIRGLAPSVEYDVVEDAEDYSSTVLAGKTNSGTIGTVAGTNKMAEAGFLNERTGVIPTGVILATGTGIAALAAGAAGIVISKRKKRKDDEQ